MGWKGKRIGGEEEELSWMGIVLDGDKVGGKWVLEWADCSVRAVLSKVECKSRGPMMSFLVKDKLPPIRQG